MALHTKKSARDIAHYFVACKGSCRILDLGSAYWGSYRCFDWASALVTVDAVDVIFRNEFIPQQSPTLQEDFERIPHVNYIGQSIQEIVRLEQYIGVYDMVIYKDCCANNITVSLLASLLNPDGVLIIGKYSSLSNFNMCRSQKMLMDHLRNSYLGQYFYLYWEINQGGMAMTRDHPKQINSFINFYFTSYETLPPF